MKNLPNIYKPKITKIKSNNKELSLINENSILEKEKIDLDKIIKEQKYVTIITTNKIYNTKIIKNFEKYIITQRNIILKNDIISIKIKSS